jgi:hypothetical protein
MTMMDGEPFTYANPGFENPYFLVKGLAVECAGRDAVTLRKMLVDEFDFHQWGANDPFIEISFEIALDSRDDGA